MFGYDELRAEQKRRRDSGDPVQLGIGISTFTEMCGLAPSRVLGSAQLRRRRLGARRACGCCATGKVEVITGTSRARPGPRDGVVSQIVADRLGVPFEDVEVLHGDTQISPQGPRHLRLPVAGRRRRGAGPGGRQGDREGQADRGAPARGVGRRPRVLRRPVRGPGHRPGHGDRRDRDRGRSPRTTCPTASSRRSTPTATYDPVNFSFPHGTHLCAMEVDTETGAAEDAQVRLRRRHRQHHQPADRRRPGARRPGAGHRPGAVGGGGVRRLRHAGVRLVRRLPAADRGRHDQLRHRPHHLAVDRPTRSAPRASARPARSPRRRPSSTRSSTRVRHLGVNDIQMPCTPERVWKAIHDAGGGGGDATEACGDAALRRGDRQPGSRRDRTEGAGQ